jgi:transcriptional regulator with XRE-family HTH domain
VQFRTLSNNCRRCKLCLDAEEPEPIVAEPVAPAPANGNGNGNGHLHIASSIRTLRQRTGLSQRQLALRMQVPRTYVSKIENDKATPTLSSLERLARALEVSVPELINGGNGHARQAEIKELMADEFIAEIVPFLSKLDPMQCNNLLAQVRDLTMRPRSSHN